MTRKYFYPLKVLALLLVLSVVLGCGLPAGQPTAAPGSGASVIPPTQTPEGYPAPGGAATTETNPTPESYPQPESPTGAPAQPGLYPPEIRTGLADLDPILAATLANDKEALRGLLRYLVTACTTAQGAGGPPKCAQGERDGSQVEVFPVLGEEAEFVRRADIDAFLDLQIAGLYAIYQVAADAPGEAYWPAGQYGLVFQGGGLQTCITLLVQDGAIVRINRLRRTPAEEVASSGAAAFILPPLDGSAGAYPAP
ncbi:MAG: hypothetical protein ACYC6L_09770 [Anaerolineae bacterium]